MIRSAILAAALLTAAPTASAADCVNAANQLEMNECAGAAYAAADTKLNDTYKRIKDRLKGDAGTSKLLVTSQKAWIAFRDAECIFQTSAAEGGSIRPFLQASCLEDLTTKRTEALSVYLACEEGDMSCPVPPAP